MSQAAAELAGTIQAAHINLDPDLAQDAAPATAADQKETVSLHGLRHGEKYTLDDEDDDEIPFSVLRPPPRNKNQLPPLPDLRFEQSYLHSIAAADTWWKVVLITTRDQVIMPLAQGVLYNLFLCGWQHWNRNARLHGNTVGARVRRWWYGVNNWKIPSAGSRR
ncbi:hypothetical protein LIA77_04289 [Sarocladium implicatum]|nr:hypothetical protein LIA77_04289 [Sarocladium implicatum]